MRRLLLVGLDALQFQRLHGGGLALDVLFQALNQFALLDDHAVHLLDLMFEMREVRLELVHAPGSFVCHEASLPARRREVETVNEVKNVARRARSRRSRKLPVLRDLRRLRATPCLKNSNPRRR